jgi:hypothetical protein
MTTIIDEPRAFAPSLRVRATDVTGTLEVEADLPPDALAGVVAQSLADRLQLPVDVPWGLRDQRGAFLDDDRQIGEQVEPNAEVTITPKTHLG